MRATAASGDRIHQALLHSLRLPTTELAAEAFHIHALVSSVLSNQAGVILHGEKSNSTSASTTLLDGKKLRLAALAVFHKLSTLQNGIPITLSSLHDFIIVYTSTASSASEDEARLARRTVESLFRKKPSLVRALENQLIPAWTEMMTSFAPKRHEDWMQEARAILRSVITMSKFATVREALQDSSASTDFWSALQALYDIGLPKSLAASASTGISSISQLRNVNDYTSLRKEIVDFFASFFPALPAQTLTECLENEASNPDIPQILADLPLTSLINLTLLQDTEYYHGISRRVGLRKPAMNSMNNDERTYIQNALDISKTLSKENITDGLYAVSKGKGKASAVAEESASTAQRVSLATSLIS